jgi:hypothetical protein
MNLLFAQESGINKDYPGNNTNVNKPEILVHQNFINNGLSSNDKIKTTVIVDTLDKGQISLLKANLNINNQGTRKSLLSYIFSSRSSGNSHKRPEKNLITSISENIEMGGISGKMAVLSFTPKLNIEPVGFISIYADQDIRYLIPIKTINEHLQLLFFQSAYILAIDNFMNLWSRTPTIIQSIAGFIAKNIISALVNGSIDNSSKSKIYSITSYCYSIKIKL